MSKRKNTSLDDISLPDIVFDDPTDPLNGVQYVGDVEKDAASELNAIKTDWRAADNREKDYKNAVRDTLDSEYWFAVCFQTRAQKEAFLKAMDWIQEGDKYLDGVELAQKHDIKLPEPTNRFFKKKSHWNEFVKGGEDNNAKSK